MIEVSGLTKRFGRTLAVDDLSFRVEPGSIVGFLGPNGAGKTTTLRALLGLVTPSRGTARIRGRPYRDLPEPSRKVGAVLEAASFHPGRSGGNHLRVVATAAGIPRSRVDEALELVDLVPPGRKRVKTYSLGMRQRLSIAAALLGDPQVLILDEPANGLDPEGIRWLRDLLRAASAKGCAVLVSSHVLAEVSQLADGVVIIHRGRLVEQASLQELTARTAGGARVRTPDAARLCELLAAEQIEATLGGDGRVAASATPERVGEIAAANGVVLHELVAESSSLEEVFLELTREAEREGP